MFSSTRSGFSFCRILLLIVSSALTLCTSSRSGLAAEPQVDFKIPTRISRIACGSCSKQDLPQPIWKSMVKGQPELFIYMGDNIYGDTEDMRVLEAKWNQQKMQPGYQLLRQNCQVIGTWDDHDYGKNDAGLEYPLKEQSQQLFLDFLDEPKDSVRRRRKGVYASYIYGPPGQSIQVILLDTRYFRTALKKVNDKSPKAEGHSGPYGPTDDPDAAMLGEEQWAWLEAQLKVPAEIRLIVSSIQVIPTEHRWEKWENLPKERARFLEVLERTHAEGVILLSGDRHAAEFCRLDRPAGLAPLWELTSSSLNSPRKPQNEINQYRYGCLYNDENYGEIEVDWSTEDPSIRMAVCDIDGQPFLQVPLRLSELRHR